MDRDKFTLMRFFHQNTSQPLDSVYGRPDIKFSLGYFQTEVSRVFLNKISDYHWWLGISVTDLLSAVEESNID